MGAPLSLRQKKDQIFILRQVMEKHYEFDKDLYMVFVDYKQAYDSINREELWNTLIYFGIPKKYVNMVKLCNNKTECKVKFLGELSSTFEVKSGLRQGDALSPTLFNLGLEKVIREINHSHLVEVVDKEIILAYADDIVILGNTRQDITQTMSNLVTASKRMGLCINEEKTKFMVLSRRREDQPNLQVDNFTFESVESFKYLGVNINNKNDMHQEIVERLASGNRCYHSIQKLLKSKLLSRRSKTLLYISYLRPIVTYACETWSTTKGDNIKLAIFERKILRKIFGPVYNLDLGTFERRKNENLYQLYGKPTILTFIRTKRMEWFGHIWRAEDDILKKVITATIQKKRPLSRPRTRWKDAVKRDIQLVDANASVELALNRERWRDLFVAAQDHIIYILTDPLGNYTLIELCIQNVGNQKWCSNACYHHERSVSTKMESASTLYSKIEADQSKREENQKFEYKKRS
ncbi:hypothetical protein QTP88_028977 [Uroleucon formosanum]